MKIQRRQFAAILGSFTAAVGSRVLLAGDKPFVEPVHRVATAASRRTTPAAPRRPLDRALDIARASLKLSRTRINDYTALLVKRERIGDTLGAHEYIEAKIRNRKISGGRIVQPLSVYLGFRKPSSVEGREVIYVEGRNDDKLIAHEGGLKGKFLPTVTIPTDGMLAMRGQRYPMTDIGIENLIVKLIERGQRARKLPDVRCEFRKNARVQDRTCTVLQVIQPSRSPDAEFHQAQVFIDDQYQIPIRYIAYDWPTQQGQPLPVIEEYNYLNLKLNVGLTDADFDPNNEAYNFY